MIFKNYCLILLGKFDKEVAFEELNKISEVKINYIYTTGLYIATFSTIMTPKEMKNLLKTCKNNYFIFELNEDVTSFNLQDKTVENGLFSFLGDIDLDEMSKNFINDINDTNDIPEIHEIKYGDEINGYNKTNDKIIFNNHKIDITEFISSLSKDEKEALFNELIDKGVDKLSDLDKRLLTLLSK
jgi:hypothetical protein